MPSKIFQGIAFYGGLELIPIYDKEEKLFNMK
jgi:hypothetical protein